MDLVYLTTNNINGKQYVGSHTTDDPNDNYFGSGIIIKRAIKKYGKEKFSKEILKICESREEAINLEEYFISEKNTLYPFGYNVSPFGHAAFPGSKNPMYGKIPWNKGKTLSIETRNKISNTLKGNKNLLGYIHSSESKMKMSENMKGRVPWNKNKKMSIEFKEKLSKSHKGQIPWNKGKKTCADTKKKLSESHKGKNPFEHMSVGECKYCGKQMKMSHLNRYHNEKCKFKYDIRN